MLYCYSLIWFPYLKGRNEKLYRSYKDNWIYYFLFFVPSKIRAQIRLNSKIELDPVTALQELCKIRRWKPPSYELFEPEIGTLHHFEFNCRIKDYCVTGKYVFRSTYIYYLSTFVSIELHNIMLLLGRWRTVKESSKKTSSNINVSQNWK